MAKNLQLDSIKTKPLHEKPKTPSLQLNYPQTTTKDISIMNALSQAEKQNVSVLLEYSTVLSGASEK